MTTKLYISCSHWGIRIPTLFKYIGGIRIKVEGASCLKVSSNPLDISIFLLESELRPRELGRCSYIEHTALRVSAGRFRGLFHLFIPLCNCHIHPTFARVLLVYRQWHWWLADGRAIKEAFLIIGGDDALDVSVGIIRAIHIFQGNGDDPVYKVRLDIVVCRLLKH